MFRTVIIVMFSLVLAADFIVTAVSKKSRLTDVIIRALMVLAFGYIAQAVQLELDNKTKINRYSL